jgi:hypothetical protein
VSCDRCKRNLVKRINASRDVVAVDQLYQFGLKIRDGGLKGLGHLLQVYGTVRLEVFLEGLISDSCIQTINVVMHVNIELQVILNS